MAAAAAAQLARVITRTPATPRNQVPTPSIAGQLCSPEVWEDFQHKLIAIAGTLLTHQLGYGGMPPLLGLWTDQKTQAYLDAGNVLSIRTGDTITLAQIKAYKDQFEHFAIPNDADAETTKTIKVANANLDTGRREYHEAMAQLVLELKRVIPKSLHGLIWEKDTQAALMSLHDLIKLLKDTYELPKEKTAEHLRKLALPVAVPTRMGFIESENENKATIAKLHEQGVTLNDDLKTKYLQDRLKATQAFKPLYDQYLMIKPERLHVYEELSKYFTDQLPILSKADEEEVRRLHSSSLVAAVPQEPDGQQEADPHLSRRKNDRKRPEKTHTKFCAAHGFTSHTSGECTLMKKDPDLFKDMLTATGHHPSGKPWQTSDGKAFDLKAYKEATKNKS
jgi:hypothetical protein